MLILQRYLVCLLLLVVGTLALAENAAAQPPAQAMPSNSRVVGRSYAVEGIVVAVLMVGAGAAVCRSSRRS